jgi:molybdopterin-guanine dinucleotide biosynthesis protein A
MDDIEGFILAGGASSRMGTDKALLRLGGRLFVERVAAALRTVAGRVRVVSSRHEAAAVGLEVVPDLRGGLGALGGIHAALTGCAAPWAAVVSCDLPFVTGALLERLASLRADGAEAADAVAPTQPDGRPQPLCALYARSACLPAAERLILTDELRPRVLLRQVRTRWVGFGELEDLEGSEHFFRNVNTPEDYRRALDEV